jgi:hypothetical protein
LVEFLRGGLRLQRSVNVLRSTMQTTIMASRMFTLARHLTKMNEFAHAGDAGRRLAPLVTP